jgi:hypothetical protein
VNTEIVVVGEQTAKLFAVGKWVCIVQLELVSIETETADVLD